MFAQYGLPEEIVSNNGPQFRSVAFAQFLNRNGIKYCKTVQYDPVANGMVEILNRTLKESIQVIHISGEAWEDSLIAVLGTYRTSPYCATTKMPAELMFGRRVRTRLNAAYIFSEKADSLGLARRKNYQEKYRRPGKTYPPGTIVRVHHPSARKGESAFGPPTRIKTLCSRGTYSLKDGSKVNARQLSITSQNRSSVATPQ